MYFMTHLPKPDSIGDDGVADVEESVSVQRAPLRARHPAEAYTLLAGASLVAAKLGLDISTDELLIGFGAVVSLPAVITYVVKRWRDSLGV